MTEVTLFNQPNLPSSATGSTTGALRQLALSAANAGGKAFMKLSKHSGRWVYGQDEVEVADDERWAVNPHSLKIGKIGWRGGQVVGEHMFPIDSGTTINEEELVPIESSRDGDGWKDQLSLELKSLDHGTEALWATTARGGINAIATLAGQIAEQMEANPSLCVPVVHLKVDSYKHKQYGKTYVPDIEVVAWVSMDGESAPAATKGRRERAALV